jgi:hypothetical protein
MGRPHPSRKNGRKPTGEFRMRPTATAGGGDVDQDRHKGTLENEIEGLRE